MASRRRVELTALLMVIVGIAGCGLPTSGPLGDAITTEATVTAKVPGPKKLPYCLVPVDKAVTEYAIANRYRFSGHLTGGRAKRAASIGIGDIVSVTLFEAASGGLFFPLEGGVRQGNFLVLPPQAVDDRGDISVPYAGRIKAAGRTVTEIQSAIVNALADKALKPQAVVTLVERKSDLINVLGEVGTPTRMPASAGGERLIDVIARAGGVRGAPTDAWVLVERDGRQQSVPFEAVIRQPANNIAVRAHDTIYLYRYPQVFVALGATGVKGLVPFENYSLSVAEGLGKANGLVDTQAEPSWVFVYRLEREETIGTLDPACRINDGGLVPVIYQFDLRQPSGLFLASQFPLQNKDVLFAANARAVEEQKLFQHVQQASQAVREPIDVAISAYTLKGLVQGTTSVIVGTSTSTTP